MKVRVTTEVEAPDGATHYCGDLLDSPGWLKSTMVGVVGEHWWIWDDIRLEWILQGHFKPHWAKEIPV